MKPKIIVPNLIIKICGGLMTIGLIALNFINTLVIDASTLQPFDIYISIALIIMFTGLWIPLKEPKRVVKPKKEVKKSE